MARRRPEGQHRTAGAPARRLSDQPRTGDMTEGVAFYVLKSAAAPQRWAFACRLTEKAYLRDMRVVIVNDSPADARALDDLLWTFNERSFIPHQICLDEHAPDPAARVYLIALPAATPAADLLVNLSDRLPAQW